MRKAPLSQRGFFICDSLIKAHTIRAGLLPRFAMKLLNSGLKALLAAALITGTLPAQAQVTETVAKHHLVAAANPAYAKAAPYATVLVAASVVVTMLTVPLITAWWAKKIGQRGGISP